MNTLLRRLTLFPHPDVGALDRYADADPTHVPHGARAERARVAGHLVRCADCRAAVAFRRELRTAVERLPTIDAPPELLARVLAERASGARGILPNVEPEARPASRRGRALVGVAAAAAVVVAVTMRSGVGPRGGERTHADRTPDSVTSADEWFVSGGLLSAVAGAQEPLRDPLPPPVGDVDGTRLRPRLVAYAARWTDTTGREHEDGRGLIALDSVRLDGQPAWRLDQRWTRAVGGGQHGERAEVETLYVARRDLRPLERHVRVAPYLGYRSIDIAQRFARDSVLGEMGAEGRDGHRVRRPIAQALPVSAGPYVTDVLTPLFLSAVRLAPEWRGSVTNVGWAVRPNDVRAAVTLRVVGTERVTVPAGTFDCWKLLVTAPGRRLDYWVRTSDGLGIATRDQAPSGSGPTRGVRRVELVSEQQR